MKKKFSVTMNWQIFMSLAMVTYKDIEAKDVEEAKEIALNRFNTLHNWTEGWVQQVEEL